ncbi:fibronectin type III domain-containing protein [Exilibacterium tricleocarpae]|nr:fibronectin type III domain-containing protein [Exilibacterium tricleocarpae]
MNVFSRKITTAILMAFLAALLTACGGGGGSGGGDSDGLDNPPTSNPPQPPNPPVTASATLSWLPPSEREDGDPLVVGAIGGYEINYRMVGGEQFSSVVVNDGAATEVVLEDLQAGRYEIYIHAFDNEGLYSIPSDTIFTSI